MKNTFTQMPEKQKGYESTFFQSGADQPGIRIRKLTRDWPHGAPGPAPWGKKSVISDVIKHTLMRR